MTGFARTQGATASKFWIWELRSVNSRGLDVRFRMPTGYDTIEPKLRDIISKALSRGNVTAVLTMERGQQAGHIRLNEEILQELLAATDRIAAVTGGPKPTPADLMTMRGLIELTEVEQVDEEARQKEHEEILQSFECALAALQEARGDEGNALHGVLSNIINEIEKLASAIRQAPSRRPEAIRQRLTENISQILENTNGLNAERLHQEAILLASKSDIEEELARIDAHIEAARALISKSAPVGRKLDFLAQEFNRETNTICSKSNGLDITRPGLELKSVIERFREQVQNIE